MRKEDIERELELLGEVLASLDGELISAEVSASQDRLLAYVRAESELAVNDIFDGFDFTVERIAYLGWPHEKPVDHDRPMVQGAWRYQPQQTVEHPSAAIPATNALPALRTAHCAG
jgi:hypothetical protein